MPTHVPEGHRHHTLPAHASVVFSESSCCAATTAHAGTADCERSRLPAAARGPPTTQAMSRCRHTATDTLTQAHSHHVAHGLLMTGSPSLDAWLSSIPDTQRRLRDGSYPPATRRRHHLASRHLAHLHAIAPRCGEMLHPGGPTRDVAERWHSACKESQGESRAAKVRATLSSLVRCEKEGWQRAAAFAGAFGVRRPTRWV